jgi:hypothetical protein
MLCPSEDRADVISKASFESIHFALVDVIEAQFVNVLRRFRIGSAERAEAEDYRGPAKRRCPIFPEHFGHCDFISAIAQGEDLEVAPNSPVLPCLANNQRSYSEKGACNQATSASTTNRTISRDRVDLVGDDCGTHSLGAWLGGGRSYVTALSHAFGLRRDRRWSKYRS